VRALSLGGLLCSPTANGYRPTAASKANAAQASHLDRIGLAEYPGAHFHARGMGELISHGRSGERTQNDATRQIATCEANSANRSAALRWPAASPAVVGGLLRSRTARATRPAPKHVSGGPSQQFTLENCQEPPALPQCSGRPRRTSRTNVSHCALRTLALQEKSLALLCRNCGWQRFLVESDGKTAKFACTLFLSDCFLIRSATPPECKFRSSL
jgi:hypothetical protein